jgi:hypothetical protein
LVILGLATAAQATAIYTFTGPNFYPADTHDFTSPCAIGPCANYTSAMRVTGSFTTYSPLPANLPTGTNISALVIEFNFSDGINTYSSDDPNVWRDQIRASTDSTGNIKNTGSGDSPVNLGIWLTGTTPHKAGDRVGTIQASYSTAAGNNAPCTVVGTSPAGDSPACTASASDGSSSGTMTMPIPPGTWTKTVTPNPAVPTPTISEWNLILLATVLCLGAIWALRRRRQA